MSGRSEAVQIPVAKIRVLAAGRRPSPFAVLDKGTRTNAGGRLFNNPFVAFARAVTGKKA